jgi:hypothetical protein
MRAGWALNNATAAWHIVIFVTARRRFLRVRHGRAGHERTTTILRDFLTRV